MWMLEVHERPANRARKDWHTLLAQLAFERLKNASIALGRDHGLKAGSTCRKQTPELPLPLLVNRRSVDASTSHTLCVQGNRLMTRVVLGTMDGFALTDEGRQKPGLVGARVGAEVTLLLINGTL